MIIIKADQASEAGVMPDEQLLSAMGNYNDELVKAGVMLAGEGLLVQLKGRAGQVLGRSAHRDRRSLHRGQGAIAGFWIWQVSSKEEAIEWVKRCRHPMGGEPEIEVRQVAEADDFGDEYTPGFESRRSVSAQPAANKQPWRSSASGGTIHCATVREKGS